MPHKSFDLPVLQRRRARPWVAPVVSAAVHAALVWVVLAAPDPAASAQGALDVPQELAVEMMYLPPGADEPPPPREEPAPAPLPPARPPSEPVPEHDERAGSPPEATSDPQPEPSAEPSASTEPPASPAPRDATTEGAVSDQPAPRQVAAASEAALMRSEAERLFGRRPRASGPSVGPAATPGFEVYLPENPDRCAPRLPEPREPGAPVELATVSGRVFRQGTRIPLAGAHLQMVGTPYVAFSDDRGGYALRFDPTLVDQCRTQYVRVTAPGYRAQTLVLYLGPASSNDIPMLRR